ncbi:DUF6801 domain-containing protein [Actinocrispum wychmicini]|uniref:DUF6801 domain-containing protein n=1 Tax=Actinocrispum wychmicini TaxID=1213861 RepID=A0A4R2INW9_9PSEU|nr:DUF6801 domain-containing protein [Actinocrispum wychmicini]TCO46507.1 hypothetical protein EV192_11986 [Actinocrispum wychmicini]
MRATAVFAAAAGIVSTAFAPASSADPTTAAGGSEPPKPVTVSLKNDCEFPVGGKQVIVTDFTTTLPKTATVGEVVDIGPVTVKFVIPEAMVKALRENGTASINGLVYVGLSADDKPTIQATVALSRTPLPDTGDLTIEQPATITANAKAAKAGDTTYSVLPLSTLLTPLNATGEPVTKDMAKVTCEIEDGQDAKLGVVTVVPAGTEAPPGVSRRTTTSSADLSATNQGGKPGTTRKTTPHNGKARSLDDDPCAVIPPEIPPVWAYYKLTGKVRLAKVQGVAEFGPGYINARITGWNDGSGGLCSRLDNLLVWPQAAANFVTYNFLPTGSAITISQDELARGNIIIDDQGNPILHATATTRMTLNLATVNGIVRMVPGPDGKNRPLASGTILNVGPNCQATVTLTLVSEPDKWQSSPQDGGDAGDVDADFTLPEFTGCGVTEDLDPLLTGLLSGPGNHISLHFGSQNFCFDVVDYPGEGPCAADLDHPPVKNNAVAQKQKQQRKAVPGR